MTIGSGIGTKEIVLGIVLPFILSLLGSYLLELSSDSLDTE